MFKRIARAIRSELRLRASGGAGLQVNVCGESFRLLPECADAVDVHYEQGKYQAVMSALEPGMIAFDIGAHHGLYGLGMAGRVGPTGKVVAFEPLPTNAVLLSRNVALNGYQDRMIVESLAVSGTIGETPFAFQAGDLTSGSLAEMDRSARSLTIHTTTLDQYCRDSHLYPDLIKLDVEGVELAVLDHAREVLAAKPGIIVHVEMHHGPFVVHGPPPEKVPQLMASLGFRVMNHMSKPLTKEEWPTEGHMLFIR